MLSIRSCFRILFAPTKIMSSLAVEELVADFKSLNSSSAALWVDLDKLVMGELIARSERREVFWNAHSPASKGILMRQEPRFDPENKVWVANDEVAIRAAEVVLMRTMHVAHLTERASRLLKLRQYWTTLSATVFVMLLIAFQNLSANPGPMKLGLCVLWGVDTVTRWLFIRGSILFREMLRQRVVRLPECVSGNSDEALQTALAFTDPVLEFEHPVADLQNNDAELWLQLEKLVDKGLISSFYRLSILWTSKNDEERTELGRKCALYSPYHPLWTSKDDAAINQANGLLTELAELDSDRVPQAINGWLYTCQMFLLPGIYALTPESWGVLVTGALVCVVYVSVRLTEGVCARRERRRINQKLNKYATSQA